jgi:ketosteroid isomerase-like protein
MRTLLLILVITLFYSCNNADRNEILEVMHQQEVAWNNGNIDGFMNGYWKSDSLKFVGKNGIKYGWQNTLENYKKSYPDKATMGTLKFDVIQLEVYGKSAFVLGKWQLKREKDTPNGYFTLFWKKINGHWVIVIDHTS